MRETRSRGAYEYCRDGQVAEIEEVWQVLERGSERRIRSSRRVPGAGIVLAVESVQRNGAWVRCDLDWHRSGDTGPTRVTASYRFGEHGIEVGLRNPAGETEVLQADPNTIFLPLLRIYTGEVIHRLGHLGRGRVLVPWLGDTGCPGRLLRPDYSERRARVIGEDRIDIDGVPRRCLAYDYSGGPYLPGTRFWVDENRLLLRYRWRRNDGEQWQVSLRDWRTV